MHWYPQEPMAIFEVVPATHSGVDLGSETQRMAEKVPSLENDEDNLENSTLRDTLFRRFCDSNDH
ncbi:hypothetical protein Pst134EA_002892 [Puccinia striiformis f. sp. tritici]|uniref:hypothetical protein n=1 Tax=Puccinia striiformis f. sp. tritici TaxID=168172 RepID=UPI002008D185|nr:hypothetical protein Pst134EA_009164 [Puccinia striiformis f. sp. tritici]XP_047811723.1 hypothetical protein Pst134EA_002892 [Puccinia striiformis f. sp. tritici]KAH9468630.1 hypothetical protein Pst134EA_009164 [Puccinia striiformis f. sp. tritici]KAH9472269.1 hypothetical protein Pst134EA_002892 [Puccinia striiformis f. sp. tritici]